MADSRIRVWRNLRLLPNLERLAVTRTRLTEKGIESLAGIRTLQALTLDYLPVTDKALESLKTLPALKQLSLDNTNITDRGAEILQIHRHAAVAGSLSHSGVQEGL